MTPAHPGSCSLEETGGPWSGEVLEWKGPGWYRYSQALQRLSWGQESAAAAQRVLLCFCFNEKGPS